MLWWSNKHFSSVLHAPLSFPTLFIFRRIVTLSFPFFCLLLSKKSVVQWFTFLPKEAEKDENPRNRHSPTISRGVLYNSNNNNNNRNEEEEVQSLRANVKLTSSVLRIFRDPTFNICLGLVVAFLLLSTTPRLVEIYFKLRERYFLKGFICYGQN